MNEMEHRSDIASIPGGDAMRVRFHRDEDAARLKRETLRRPITWRIHPEDAAEFAAQGKHCERRRGTRRCQDPITVVTWRWYRSAEAGRVLVVERLTYGEHGAEFAGRHGIKIEPPPAEPQLPRSRPGSEGGTR